MDPHRKHLPPEDVFIARRLDARHLHGSEATDKLGLLPARARRTRESPNKTVLQLRPSGLGHAARCCRVVSDSTAVALETSFFYSFKPQKVNVKLRKVNMSRVLRTDT